MTYTYKAFSPVADSIAEVATHCCYWHTDFHKQLNVLTCPLLVSQNDVNPVS